MMWWYESVLVVLNFDAYDAVVPSEFELFDQIKSHFLDLEQKQKR